MPVSDGRIPSNAERARQWYARLRSEVETPATIGKLISIDLETGDFAIGDDDSLSAPRSLRAKNPKANVFTLRSIGYGAVYAVGGVLERTTG